MTPPREKLLHRHVGRAGALLLLATAAMVGILVAMAPSALAHGGEAGAQVIVDGRAENGGYRYEVFVQYLDDRDPVEGAVLTLTGTGENGTEPVSVPMAATADAGHYATTVSLPTAGVWKIAIASTAPVLDVQRIITAVGPSVTTTVASSEVTDPNGAVISKAPATATAEGSRSTSGADDSSMLWVWTALGVAVIVVIGLGLKFGGSRSGTSDGTDSI